MRKLSTLGAMLLLAGSVALAQSSGSTAAPSPSPTAGQTTVIRGCLKGNVLSSGGTSYQLSGNTNDLAAHDGHTVEITGTNVSDQNQQATQPNQQQFNVQSVSMISDKCESNVGQTPDTKGMTSAQQSSTEAGGTGSSTQPRNPSDLQSPNGSAAPDNSNVPANNPNATNPPKEQSSVGTSPDMNSQSSAGMQNNSTAATTGNPSGASQPSATTGSQSDMNASTSSAQTGATPSTSTTGDQSASTSQSNPQSMNSPTASSTTAETANPTGQTAAGSQAGAAASDQSATTSSSTATSTATSNPSDQTSAATAAAPSSGTSATDSAQGTETAQANQGNKGGALPQTGSELPMLALAGFGSLAGGLIARFRK